MIILAFFIMRLEGVGFRQISSISFEIGCYFVKWIHMAPFDQVSRIRSNIGKAQTALTSFWGVSSRNFTICRESELNKCDPDPKCAVPLTEMCPSQSVCFGQSDVSRPVPKDKSLRTYWAMFSFLLKKLCHFRSQGHLRSNIFIRQIYCFSKCMIFIYNIF